jgi:hypothetical protein
MRELSGFGALFALLRGDGDGRVDTANEDPWPISDRVAPYAKTGEERNPTSDCVDREVIVRFRVGRNVASSSLSDSPPSE